MAWFSGDQDLPLKSYSFIGNYIGKDDNVSQGSQWVKQQLDLILTQMENPKRGSDCQESSSFQSYSFVDTSTGRKYALSQSLDSMEHTLRLLQANLESQERSPFAQECYGLFHHPYYTPYH